MFVFFLEVINVVMWLYFFFKPPPHTEKYPKRNIPKIGAMYFLLTSPTAGHF